MNKQQGWLANKVKLAVLILSAVIFLLPLVITFTNSFMAEGEVALNFSGRRSVFDVADNIYEKFIELRIVPETVTFSQYKAILAENPSFLILMGNSAKIAFPVVAGNIMVSILAAYGFTVWQHRYKEILFYMYIIVMLMPLQAILVPNFIIANKLGIADNYLAIILPGIFSPFGTFLLRQSMKTIPKSYYESARMDGAGEVRIFLSIILPQMKSGIAALGMLTFIEYWNIVEQAIIFIKDYTKEPLSVYLSRIAEGRISIIFAASCVYMAIPLWALIMGQKDLEKGIELSGVK